MAKIIEIYKVRKMRNNKKITIFSVAQTFLNFESMSPKKLQKLCYYAYAWHITLCDKRKLFDNHFEAWIHGPVNPELYDKYREYGWSEIPKVEKLPNEIAENRGIYEFIEMVYGSYGHLDANQLEYLTHQEMPWINARQGLAAHKPSNNVINVEDVFNQYSQDLKNDQEKTKTEI